MSAQLPLEFAPPPHSGFDDWIAGPNVEVTEFLRQQAERGSERIWLHGPRGSGRSHLLHALAAHADASGRSVMFLPAPEVLRHCGEQAIAPASALDGLESFDVVLIDDVETWAGEPAFEEALFDLCNRVLAAERLFVMAAPAAPDDAGFALPDLRSRLAGAVRFALTPLAGDDLAALLRVQARRRGLRLDESLCRYLLTRLDRSAAAIVDALERLDSTSLRDRAPVTKHLARRVLGLGA